MMNKSDHWKMWLTAGAVFGTLMIGFITVMIIHGFHYNDWSYFTTAFSSGKTRWLKATVFSLLCGCLVGGLRFIDKTVGFLLFAVSLGGCMYTWDFMFS